MRGAGAAGVTGSCATAGRTVALTVADSIVWGFARGFELGGGTLSATYSDFPEATGDTNLAADPRFAGPGDARPLPGSPVVDAGHPGALSDTEPHEDALGYVRVADGSGDGALRRDMGALELQPPAPAPVAGNALSNPGAEAGTPAGDDTSSPAPPQWTRSGAFTFVRYGTMAGQFPFPSDGWGRRSARATRSSPPARARATRPRRWSTCATPRPRSTSARAPRRSRRCSAATAGARTARSSRPPSAIPAARRSAACRSGP